MGKVRRLSLVSANNVLQCRLQSLGGGPFAGVHRLQLYSVYRPSTLAGVTGVQLSGPLPWFSFQSHWTFS